VARALSPHDQDPEPAVPAVIGEWDVESAVDLPVANDRVVTLELTLRDGDGELLDGAGDGDGGPFVYLHGHENVVPGLEAALRGRRAGDAFEVAVEPADGYGERTTEELIELPLEMFEGEVEPGDELVFETEDGEEAPIWVVEVEGDRVRVDVDHPLAGVRLHYEGRVLDVRDASELELEQGYPQDDDDPFATAEADTA